MYKIYIRKTIKLAERNTKDLRKRKAIHIYRQEVLILSRYQFF